MFAFYSPNKLNDPNNYILANSTHTPRHIVSEWYFLPFYAMLRSIFYKAAGIMTMFFSLIVLFVLPSLNISLVKNASSQIFLKLSFLWVIVDFMVLGRLGQSLVEDCLHFHESDKEPFIILRFLLYHCLLMVQCKTSHIYCRIVIILGRWKQLLKMRPILVWANKKSYKHSSLYMFMFWFVGAVLFIYQFSVLLMCVWIFEDFGR